MNPIPTIQPILTLSDLPNWMTWFPINRFIYGRLIRMTTWSDVMIGLLTFNPHIIDPANVYLSEAILMALEVWGHAHELPDPDDEDPFYLVLYSKLRQLNHLNRLTGSRRRFIQYLDQLYHDEPEVNDLRSFLLYLFRRHIRVSELIHLPVPLPRRRELISAIGFVTNQTNHAFIMRLYHEMHHHITPLDMLETNIPELLTHHEELQDLDPDQLNPGLSESIRAYQVNHLGSRRSARHGKK